MKIQPLGLSLSMANTSLRFKQGRSGSNDAFKQNIVGWYNSNSQQLIAVSGSTLADLGKAYRTYSGVSSSSKLDFDVLIHDALQHGSSVRLFSKHLSPEEFAKSPINKIQAEMISLINPFSRDGARAFKTTWGENRSYLSFNPTPEEVLTFLNQLQDEKSFSSMRQCMINGEGAKPIDYPSYAHVYYTRQQRFIYALKRLNSDFNADCIINSFDSKANIIEAHRCEFEVLYQLKDRLKSIHRALKRENQPDHLNLQKMLMQEIKNLATQIKAFKERLGVYDEAYEEIWNHVKNLQIPQFYDPSSSAQHGIDTNV